MDDDLRLILRVLTHSRMEIDDLVRPKESSLIYYDRDSEDEGTEVVEVAFLRLCDAVFGYRGRDDELQDQLNEMSCIIGYSLYLYDFGPRVFLLQTEQSGDLFWEILARYSKSILSKHERLEVDSVREFSFGKMLEEYGFSYEERVG